MFHEEYLATLEALYREWGPLAYGPAGKRPASAEAECARARGSVTEAMASEWAEGIVAAVRALTETRAWKRNFSILEIGAAGFSVTPRLRTEFPDARSYVTCPQGRSCPIHRFPDDAGVRVYAVDARQIFGTAIRKRRQIFDVVLALEPAIMSPLRRPLGGGRYLPELAVHWLNENAGFYCVAVHETTSPIGAADGSSVRRVATGPGDLVLLCASRTSDKDA